MNDFHVPPCYNKNIAGIAELHQSGDTSLIAQHLHAAAGDAPFCGGFGD